MKPSVTDTHILPKYQMLGYPQSDVSFQIDAQAKTLFMTDLDKGGRSLTNDMENALCRILFFQRLRGKQFVPSEYMIMCQDSEGSIDGVDVRLKSGPYDPLRIRMGITFYPISLDTLPVCLSR